MSKFHELLTYVAIVGAACVLCQTSVNAQESSTLSDVVAAEEAPQSAMNVGTNGHYVHILPTVQGAAALQGNQDTGPLLYHSGGAVMNPSVAVYPIFWVPAKLQNGGATGMSSHYQGVQINMLGDYAGHGIGNINTQYYQQSGGVTTYIQNKGGLGAAYLDTSPYPASGCHDSATPGNCLTDLQLQAEVKKVMAFAKLTGGLNKIFMVYTSFGEGSCFDSSNQSCAYTQYCAYHSYFNVGTVPVVYANEPYGNSSVCQVSGAPSPNSDAVADAAATSASHELSEAITDPKLNAWFSAQGSENGDLCAYTYGSLSWAGGRANQMWNGHFYLLQREFSNHTNSCLQVGP